MGDSRFEKSPYSKNKVHKSTQCKTVHVFPFFKDAFLMIIGIYGLFMYVLSLFVSVLFFQPTGEHLAILFVSIDKAGVAGMSEQMPLAVRYVLVERGCHNGCADVARATTDKDGQGDLAKLVGVLEILQTAKWLILIRAPAIEIGFCA